MSVSFTLNIPLLWYMLMIYITNSKRETNKRQRIMRLVNNPGCSGYRFGENI